MDVAPDESVDFDFFETPRSPKYPDVSKEKKSTSISFNDNKAARDSRSPSVYSSSPEYSSDTLSESEDNSKDADQSENNKLSDSRSPSISSLSSVSSNFEKSDSDSIHSSKKSHLIDDRSSKNTNQNSSAFHSYTNKESNNISQSSIPSTKNKRDKHKISFDMEADTDEKYPHDNYFSNKQAWSDNQGENSFNKSSSPRRRPKSAKRVVRSDRKQSEDHLSESDMTDVSPIVSPRHETRDKHSKQRNTSKDSPRTDTLDDSRRNNESQRNHDLRNKDTESFDLDILMEAVGELEKQKRLKANTRRVMFAPVALKKHDKSNFTFDKQKARDIERENERLLKEIVRRVNTKEPKKQFRQGPNAFRATASAVNRDREMRRIESENLALLKRLQNVKPTKAIARENQLKSFESTKLHGVPIAALHPVPRSRSRRSGSMLNDSSSSLGSRTRSLASITSAISTGRSSRHSSRPSSATRRVVDNRPQWSDRW